jgi:uncharacterized protein involved in response to NO
LSTDPYRLLFPLGVFLAWAGVGQWLLFTFGVTPEFRVVFHAMVQIQGFLGCFVAGFLLTFIPRRTMTDPPAAWQTLWAAVNPVLLAVFAWQGRWAVAQVFWLLQLGLLGQFAFSRIRAAAGKRPVVPSLIWIPAALAIGLGGALLTPFPGWHDVGRALVLEGFVTALVIGIGSMLVPVITRAQAPLAPGLPGRWYRWHVIAVAIFVASFFPPLASGLDGRGGYLLRLVIVGWVLVWGAQLWRRPTQPGLNRRLVMIAAWCVPSGYLLLSAWPTHRSMGLHVLFLGGFGLLAFSVGHHVLMAHSGRGRWIAGSSAGTWGLLLCIACSLTARLAMQFDPMRYLQWMTAATIFFLAAGALWLVEAFRPMPKMAR